MVERKDYMGSFMKSEFKSAPWGMLSYDKEALSAEQQEYLNALKTPELRHGSIEYLMAHPQVDAVLSTILRAIFLYRPRDPIKFATETVQRPDFRKELDRYLIERGSRKDGRLLGDNCDLFTQETLRVEKTEVSEEQRLTAADFESSPWTELVEALLSAVSLSSVESADSLKALAGKCEDESLRGRRRKCLMKEVEEKARKLIAEKFFETGEEENSPDGE